MDNSPKHNCLACLAEYTGFSTSTLDQNPALATGNSTTWLTNTATTTQNEELLIAMVVTNGGTVTSTVPFVTRATNTSGVVFGVIADERVDTTGTYSATGSTTTGAWLAQLATFKAASNTTPVTPYWTFIFAGYSNTFLSQAFINTTGTTWLKTTTDPNPWILFTQNSHVNTIEGAGTAGDTGNVNMSLPVMPVFPLVGWVGNPITATMGFKVSDAPGDGEFTVQVYGTSHTYYCTRNTTFQTFGGGTNNGLAMRFD